MNLFKGVKRFIGDFFDRHKNMVNRIFHIIGIPQALLGIFQIVSGSWKQGLINLFLGYLWQWLGHAYFEKNDIGEVLLIKALIKKIKKSGNS
jgi:hypothetical protein